jgi:hypothetical protein
VRLRDQWLCEAEELLEFQWPVITAGDYLQFKRNGNRNEFESLYFRRRGVVACLALAECIEAKGRFLDKMADGLWLICEESTWCIPAHLYMSARSGEGLPQVNEPLIDLFAADTAALLSWVVYLLKDQLNACTPLVAERVRQEVDRRILSPYLARDDFWWMGFGGAAPNNWNPWCNSNCLTAALLLEEDGERRLSLLHKITDSIDRFLAVQYADGGCDEGASYWGVAAASLFDCLELLYLASDGALSIYGEPLIGKLGQYIVKMFVDQDYYVNFADGAARPSLDYSLIRQYGRRIGDDSMKALGLYGLRRQELTARQGKSGGRVFMFRELLELFAPDEPEAEPSSADLYLRDAWLPDIQVLTARERPGSPQGLHLAVKGGHNQESHNHNDIGQTSVYLDGLPVLIDPGVGVYTAKTFSPKRYEIWTMASRCHNVPVVNGFGQEAGRNYRARDVSGFLTDLASGISMDLAGAYPGQADIVHWRRRVVLHRSEPAYIELTDDYKLGSSSVPAAWTFMSCCVPRLEKGRILLRHESGPGIYLQYDPGMLEARFETIPLDDPKLQAVWGAELYRIQLMLQENLLEAVVTFQVSPV